MDRITNILHGHYSYEEYKKTELEINDNEGSYENYQEETLFYKECYDFSLSFIKKVLAESPVFTSDIERVCEISNINYDDFCIAVLRSTVGNWLGEL